MVLDTRHLRTLGTSDLPALVDLLDRDPDVNLFVRHRVDLARSHPEALGVRLWGWFEGDRLVSACHVGANIVPVGADVEAIEAYARRLLTSQLRPASIVGPDDAVLALWSRLEDAWGPARSPRPVQPLLRLDHQPAVEPDPRLRRVGIDEVDLLYPSSVAMFREEVGIDPEAQGGQYRGRVSHLVAQGHAFAVIEDGRVLFKAEVGASTSAGCQLQGVYVPPDLRGRGIAPAALAGVVELCRASVAPSVSLYVNDHNTAARRLYDRVGFEQIGTFASILL